MAATRCHYQPPPPGTWDQAQRPLTGTWDQAARQEVTSYKDPLWTTPVKTLSCPKLRWRAVINTIAWCHVVGDAMLNVFGMAEIPCVR